MSQEKNSCDRITYLHRPNSVSDRILYFHNYSFKSVSHKIHLNSTWKKRQKCVFVKSCPSVEFFYVASLLFIRSGQRELVRYSPLQYYW